MKKYIIVIGIFLLIFITFLLYLYFRLPDLGPKVSLVEIYSINFEENIYIKKKVWGLLGNDQVIVVSKSNESSFEPDINREYVFKGLSPFFYNF